MQTLQYFKNCFPDVENLQELYNKYKDIYNTTRLVNLNLNDGKSRNIMVIVNNFEHAMDYAESLCNIQ